jgi:hypothetical protein
MAVSTARRLRQSALDRLDGEEEVLARVRVLTSGGRLTLAERDQLLFELVALYRRGPRAQWAPVLLDVMAPPLMQRLKRFKPQPPAIDDEDVAQHFLAEVLEAALKLPLDTGPRCLERRLILRAATPVSRWLQREVRSRSWVTSLEALIKQEESEL